IAIPDDTNSRVTHRDSLRKERRRAGSVSYIDDSCTSKPASLRGGGGGGFACAAPTEDAIGDRQAAHILLGADADGVSTRGIQSGNVFVVVVFDCAGVFVHAQSAKGEGGTGKALGIDGNVHDVEGRFGERDDIFFVFA